MEIKQMLELGPYFTFEPSKRKPIYNWFYYKEAFSPEIVEWAINQEAKSNELGGMGNVTGSQHNAHRSKLLLDPFCGIGTSMLYSKSRGLQGFGSDVSPLAVLAGRVKCADYTLEDISQIREWMHSAFSHPREPSARWDFELFSPRAVFPRSNYNTLLSLRERIAEIENETVRNFLLLALLSIIPQVGIFIKDGGVLKIDKRKSAMPVKEAFKRKVKIMLRDLGQPITGSLPQIEQADARALPWPDACADIVVTSPPYLNNVDYTKVYGLELSLMFLEKSITQTTRGQSLRSFITTNLPPETVPPEIGEAAYKIPVIGHYFADLDSALREIRRVLKPGAACYLIIGNSVIHGTEIFVDELLVSIAQRLGFQGQIVVGSERWADVKPRKVKLRESILILRK